ncbi:DUF3168 domain-containing protein [Solibacillus sp. FSL R7-0668]|uniref:tail completion protein gp17 n=1 Tax=Solibacillus sp. FSL R7-0668 TaxID=2921688 RepID=UPI0030FC6C9F
MSSPLLELQSAIVQRLASDSDLLALMPIDLMAAEEKDRRLYDYIPEDALSPYIHIDAPVISKVYVAPHSLVDVSLTLHIWHNQQLTGEYGNHTPALLLQAVKQALRFKLLMPSYQVMQVKITNERIFEDTNVDVKHGVLSCTYKLLKV